jgi:hypothetical protein
MPTTISEGRPCVYLLGKFKRYIKYPKTQGPSKNRYQGYLENQRGFNYGKKDERPISNNKRKGQKKRNEKTETQN